MSKKTKKCRSLLTNRLIAKQFYLDLVCFAAKNILNELQDLKRNRSAVFKGYSTVMAGVNTPLVTSGQIRHEKLSSLKYFQLDRLSRKEMPLAFRNYLFAFNRLHGFHPTLDEIMEYM